MAAEVKALFEGTWESARTENLDAYLDAIDVGFAKKKVISNLSPTQKIVVNGDDIEITITGGPASMMKMENKFQLNKTFDVDGEIKGKGDPEFKDGKLIIKVTPSDAKKKPQVITREIINGELVQSMECDGKVGKRFFKKK